ncbi:MAG TPA: DNA repair protein RecN, partial [Agriterribacter sp.]|nr:DNA repair protein RecN [Agriterribacter sp.]
MLQKLFIQNYAIIESVEIEFSNNLNIITGETGAGKSILVGALGLILGERADSSVLFNDTQKCIVEGRFFMNDRGDVKAFLQENDLETEEEIIIRREVSATGKSRAFINDIPVPLSRLKQFTSLLVDLHQQFDTLELGDNDFQLAVIDALAGHKNTLTEYHVAYTGYNATQKALHAAREQQLAVNKELDYYKFQYNELEEAQWKENELEDLDAELKLLGNAENIKSVLAKVLYELSEGDQPFVQQLKGLSNQLQSINDFHRDIPSLVSRLQSAQIELRDIADEIEHLDSGIRFDEERIQLVSDRLALGHKLLKKHGVRTTAELLQIQHNLEQELNKVLNLDTEIAQLEKKVKTELQAATALAQTLTNNRQKQLAPFEKETNKLLVQVGMPNARIKISLSEAPLDVTGGDNIEFLFDANKSNRFESLKKVASGGELSRLMLCIKSLVAISVQLPTLIFDEIDTGISGEAARQVGIIMKTLGQSHQVIAITHQPQIAAKADAHFFVYKKEKEQKINTRIKLLSAEERIQTIAQ